MLPIEALAGMNIMFGTPCFSGGNPNYIASIFTLASHLGRLGVDCTLQTLSESLVPRARNRICARFLAGGFTHLFWIDSDVGFRTERAMRLLLADKEVVAGIYPIKEYAFPDQIPGGMTWEQLQTKFQKWPINVKGGTLKDDGEGFGYSDGRIEAPTGFMCIKRDAILKMIEKFPDLAYEHEHDKVQAGRHYLFFDTEVRDKRYLSEDYAFCHRCYDCGVEVFIDLYSKLSHSGPHTWFGDLHASLEAGCPQFHQIAAAAE